MQQIASLVLSRGDTSINETVFHERSPCLDFDEGENPDDVIKTYLKLPSPRVMKSHMHYEHLRDVIGNGVKVIHVVRNPKDVLVSFYHFYRMTVDYCFFEGSWGDFFELYKR